MRQGFFFAPVLVLAALVLAVPLCSHSQDLEIYCIEVGLDDSTDFYNQGDSTLIISPTGTSLLIDGGASGDSGSNSVLALFGRIGLTGLDYMLTTHWDNDHDSGLDNIASYSAYAYRPTTIYDLGDAATEAESGYRTMFSGRMTTPAVGDTLDLGGGCTLTFVSVDGNMYGGGYTAPADANARSIGVLVQYGGFDYLSLGDITTAYENVLGPALAADGYEIDVLHVSHHGSRNSTSNAFVSSILPECAVISCGDNNGYGHPHQYAINHLNALTNAGAAYSPAYAPVTTIFALERGDTTAGTAANVTVVGAGHDTDPTQQGSLLITVTDSGDSYTFTNEGPNTTTISDGPFACDEPSSSGALLEETFETSHPPSGWLQNATTWSTTYSHSSSHSVSFNAAADYLITPLLATPGTLTYWVRATAGVSNFRVQYSSASTGPWTALPGSPTGTSYAGAFTEETFDLSGYTNIYLKFSRSSGTKTYYLDDVTVTDASGATSSTDVVINQVCPFSSPGEYVELYNAGTSDASLTGWRLDVYGGDYTFTASDVVPAGGYYLIADAATVSGVTADVNTGINITDNGANSFARLLDSSSTVVDTVGWASSSYYEGTILGTLSSGRAWKRDADGVDTGDNASDFSSAAPAPRNSSS